MELSLTDIAAWIGDVFPGREDNNVMSWPLETSSVRACAKVRCQSRRKVRDLEGRRARRLTCLESRQERDRDTFDKLTKRLYVGVYYSIARLKIIVILGVYIILGFFLPFFPNLSAIHKRPPYGPRYRA